MKIGDHVKMKTTIFREVQNGDDGVVVNVSDDPLYDFDVHFVKAEIIIPMKESELYHDTSHN